MPHFVLLAIEYVAIVKAPDCNRLGGSCRRYQVALTAVARSGNYGHPGLHQFLNGLVYRVPS